MTNHKKQYKTDNSDILKIATLNLLNNTNQYTERLSILTDWLDLLQPDVLTVQEALNATETETKEALQLLGYEHVIYAPAGKQERPFGNAIFSKIPFKETKVLPPATGNTLMSPVAIIEHNGNTYHIISAHFTFGSKKQPERVKEALRINSYGATEMKNNEITILAGDLNCEPESDTIQFLKGNRIINNSSTYWIDSYDELGTKDNWATSDTNQHWGAQTALRTRPNSTYPGLVKPRRIDYIMVHDWRYGQAGTPLTYNTWGQKRENDPFEVSDHYGIIVEILSPQKK